MSAPKQLSLEQRKKQADLIGRRVRGSHDAELRISGHVPEPPQRKDVRPQQQRVIVLPSTDEYRRELDELKRARSK